MPQYQGVWSLQQQMQALTSGQWATDPLFDYTTLLLQGDAGANGAQNNVFYDTSPNQFAITRNGNTTQGTFSPFSLQPGAWGNYFNGSSSLDTSSTAVSNFGTGAYTVEFWIYLSSYSAGVVPFIWGCPAVAGPPQFNVNSNGTLALAASGGSTVFTSTSTLPLNTWTHVALVRTSTSSNGLTCYFNGVAGGTGTDATNWSATQSFRIATSSSGGSDWSMTGYLSNFRVCKAAVYTGNFTPSTIALTTTSQGASSCVLLACQNNRFLDNSSTASTFTVTGTPSVQAFSPFAPQFQYTASVTGGSGYFDGTTDYLSCSASASPKGTQNFTIEGWAYVPSAATDYAILIDNNSSGGFYLRITSSGKIRVTQTNIADIVTSSSSVIANSWNYFSVTRSGNTFNIYLNSTSVDATTSNSVSFSTGTATFVGADYNGNLGFSGYMSSLRVVIGTATAPTSIPTAPFTAISGTALLLNFTNAGILDGTMKNNLETVGNASVSTSVVKYGSGSMYFDGSGDYLDIPQSDLYSMRTGDFTLEFWIYFVSTSTTVFFTGRNSTTPYIQLNSGALQFGYNGGPDNVINYTWNPSANTWYHVAFVRSNGVLSAYINGSSVASAANTTNWASPSFVRLGVNNSAAFPLNGYMDDFRLTKGIARYTQNFIPPRVALPRQ